MAAFTEEILKKRKRKQLVQRIWLVRAKAKKAVFHNDVMTIWTSPKENDEL